jgi:hypothetical protein
MRIDRPLRRLHADTRGHEAAPTSDARACTNAILIPCGAAHLLIASSEARGVADRPVVRTVGPKHPLSFGGVYEQRRAAREVRSPAFARREVSRRRSAET